MSRLAYELLLDERDRLREREAELVDHLTRVRRKEAGMPELPREPAPKRVKMPTDIRDHILGFESSATRAQLQQEFILAVHDGMELDEIRAKWGIGGEGP